MSNPLSTFAKIPTNRRSKWFVVAAWIIIAIALFPLFNRLDEVTETGPAADLPRGAESAAVLTELEKFRTVADLVPAVIVYTRDTGITAADRAKVEEDRATFEQFVARGEEVSPAIPSEDGKALMVVAPLPRDEGVDWPVRDMRAASAIDAPEGLDIVMGGPGGLLNDYGAAFENLDANLIVATSSVVVLLLLLIYRSPFLWFFPLLSVGFAAALTQGSTFLLAKYADLPVNQASSSILMVLVFGVGTDYALLLIARYREELRNEQDKHAAMRVALRRSGPAILASAGTVVLGLACLALADMHSSRSLGLVGAVGVACGYLAMVTVLPALLLIAGRWVFWPFKPAYGSAPKAAHGIWHRIGRLVTNRPRVSWLVSLVVIGTIALGALGMNMGLGQSEVFQDKPEAIVAQEKLALHFPSGASDPAIVIADSDAERQVVAAVGQVDRAQVGETSPSPDGTRVSISVVLDDAPDSSAAVATIEKLRDAVHAVPDANAVVGGATAEMLDSDNASSRDVLVVIPVVLLVILLVLICLLRAIVAPIMLLATVAVSYFAALGASSLIFENVLGHGGVDWALPLVSFVFLAALGVDYNIFLMTRVREETMLHGHREGVLRGLTATGGVITSAGIVLAATFATFMVMPVVDMVQFGVVVGVGVLMDAFLVRTVLVPALSLDIGRAIWWPSKLFTRLGNDTPTTATPTLEPARQEVVVPPPRPAHLPVTGAPAPGCSPSPRSCGCLSPVITGQWSKSRPISRPRARDHRDRGRFHWRRRHRGGAPA